MVGYSVTDTMDLIRCLHKLGKPQLEEQAMTDKKPDPMNVMRRIMRTFYTLSKSERAFLLAKLGEINEEMA